jgi:hypothetical protein
MADEIMQRKDELRKMLIELRYEIVSKIAQEIETKLDEDPRISRLIAMDIGDLSQFDLDDDIDFALFKYAHRTASRGGECIESLRGWYIRHLR